MQRLPTQCVFKAPVEEKMRITLQWIWEELAKVINANIGESQADSLVQQNATVGPITIASEGEQFEFEYTLIVTTSDAAAGSIQLSVGYTDVLGATTQSGASLVLTATGRQTGRFVIQRSSGNVTWTITRTGSAGNAKYAFYYTLRRSA